MEHFFQSFRPTARVIRAFILDEKLVKVNYHQGEFTLDVVETWSKSDREASAKEFFVFYKKKIATIDIPSLPMGERLALIEVTEILEEYIETYLWSASLVKTMLIKELFSIKLGGIIPRKYADGFTSDMNFIRQNGLADIMFYHGIALRFDPERGVGFPILSRNGHKTEVFFCDLKSYDLNLYKKFYHQGEYLFSTDEAGVMVDPPRILEGAISIHRSGAPFMTFKSGFPDASVDLHYRDQDVFAVLHDGEGGMYRVGVENNRAVFPDQFVYNDEKGFNKVSMDATNEMIGSCMQCFYGRSIKNVETMVHVIAKTLEFEGEYLEPVTSNNKFLSYFHLPKVIKKIWNKQVPISAIFKPWSVKEIAFDKLAMKRGEASKT